MASSFALLSFLILQLFTVASAQHDLIRGVVILTRNGDCLEYYQDPVTYKPFKTKHTPLSAVSSS
jgi:hypothetical protein